MRSSESFFFGVGVPCPEEEEEEDEGGFVCLVVYLVWSDLVWFGLVWWCWSCLGFHGILSGFLRHKPRNLTPLPFPTIHIPLIPFHVISLSFSLCLCISPPAD
jgi:hypothetical protein